MAAVRDEYTCPWRPYLPFYKYYQFIYIYSQNCGGGNTHK